MLDALLSHSLRNRTAMSFTLVPVLAYHALRRSKPADSALFGAVRRAYEPSLAFAMNGTDPVLTMSAAALTLVALPVTFYGSRRVRESLAAHGAATSPSEA